MPPVTLCTFASCPHVIRRLFFPSFWERVGPHDADLMMAGTCGNNNDESASENDGDAGMTILMTTSTYQYHDQDDDVRLILEARENE